MIDNLQEEDDHKEKKVIKDATAFSGTLYFSQALYVARGFIIAQVLGPALYGVWSIFKAFFASAPYFGLGTQQAMLREVPFSAGEGNKNRKAIITQTSLSWNLLLTSMIMILAFIISFTSFAAEYAGELRLAGFLFVLNALHVFIRTKFKSEQKILMLSKFMLSYAVLNTLFGLTFLFFFRLSGLLIGMILAHISLFIYLIKNDYLSLQFFIDKKILKELLGIGFPIMILMFLFFLMGNIDKFLVFIFLGKTTAGYYGLAAFVSSMVGYISHSISTVIFPRMMYMYGKTQEIKQIEKYLNKPLVFLSAVIPIILGLIYINIEAVINLFLPQYKPGVTALHILIAALLFSTLWSLPTNMLIALKKQKKFMYMNGTILILSIIFDIAAILAGFGLNGVAVVRTFFFFLASAIANGYAYFSLKKNIHQIINNLFTIYWPFIYSFAGMFFIMAFSFSNQVIFDNLLKSLLFLLFNIPILIYIEKKSNILSKVFTSFGKFKK